MNENDENTDSLLDAASDVEHLRLEVSENGEVFYGIDGFTKGANNFFFVFFCALYCLLEIFRPRESTSEEEKERKIKKKIHAMDGSQKPSRFSSSAHFRDSISACECAFEILSLKIIIKSKITHP